MAANATSLPPLSRLIGSSNVNAGSLENLKQMKPVVWYIPMVVACYLVTLALAQKFTDWKGLKLQRLAGQLSMYPAFFVLIITSHGATLDRQFWADHHARFDNSEYCDHFANFYVAVNIVQAIGQIQTEKPPLLYQLMAHHVLSVACYTSAFYFDRFRWWATFAGCCEITNLFLVPVFASKDYFPEWRKERWYLWNTRLLWLTFVTHRLVLFPFWLGLWAMDRWHASIDENAEPLHLMEGVLYPVTILSLLVLSLIWFLSINRGLKKQLATYLEAKSKKEK